MERFHPDEIKVTKISSRLNKRQIFRSTHLTGQVGQVGQAGFAGLIGFIDSQSQGFVLFQ
jgi:hypothetical protein